MCLAAAAIAQSPRWVWVIASNRDEFFDRAAAPLAWWQPQDGGAEVLSGRDLAAGGTWLGLTRSGRLALVTNVREPGCYDPAAASRGALVPQWLLAQGAEAECLQAMRQVPRNGFNFLALDLRGERGLWLSNRAAGQRALGLGLVGLSNAALDTPWPKVQRLKQRLAAAVADSATVDALVAAAYAALADHTPAPDAELPATGLPLARERQLSPAFIRIAGDAAGRVYGSRCSTVVVVEQAGAARRVHVFERSFDAAGAISAEVGVEFELRAP